MILIFQILILFFSSAHAAKVYHWKIDGSYEPFLFNQEQSGTLGKARGTTTVLESYKLGLHYKVKDIWLILENRASNYKLNHEGKEYSASVMAPSLNLSWKRFLLRVERHPVSMLVGDQSQNIDIKVLSTTWVGFGYRFPLISQMRMGALAYLPVQMELEGQDINHFNGYRFNGWIEYWRRFSFMRSSAWTWSIKLSNDHFFRSFQVDNGGNNKLRSIETGLTFGVSRLF